MARLILSLDGTVLAEYNMNKERYTIGRLPDNDIRIDNPAVSGHHSLIINILNDSFLEDLNSTNGTYVNGKLIKKHALQHGDVITAGHHQLRFVEDDEAQQDEFEKTMVIPPSARPVERVRAAVSEAGTTASRRALANGAPAIKKAKLPVLSGGFGRRARGPPPAPPPSRQRHARRPGVRGCRSRRSRAARKAISSCTSTPRARTTSRSSTAPRSAPRRANSSITT